MKSTGEGNGPMPKRQARVVAGLFLVLACVALGAAIGLMSARLLAAQQPTGWDAIADALGGVFVGAVSGLIAGAYLTRGLSVRARWWSAGVALVLALGTLWTLALTAG